MSPDLAPHTSKAFHLNAGFNCTDKCHICDAGDWHRFDANAMWRSTIGHHRRKSPYHRGTNPLLSIPGMCNTTILPDSCHCFHLGWGVDLAASGLVLLTKEGIFPGRTLDDNLYEAYSQFMSWCSCNKKTSSITWWSHQKLDMSTKLE